MQTKLSGQYLIPRQSILTQLSEVKSEFTILDQSLASIPEMDATWKVFEGIKEFRYLVPLTPSRVILHELAVIMQSYIKQELEPGSGEETFKKMVLNANEEAKKSPLYQHLLTQLNDSYMGLKEVITNFLQQGIPGTLTNEEQALIKELTAKTQKKDPVGTIQGLRAIIYMQRAQESANRFAYSLIVEQLGLPRIPELNQNDTIALFTVGGPASGKTSSLKKIAQAVFQKYNIRWDEIVHTNLDRSRIIFVPQHTPLMSNDSLTSDEGRLLKERETQFLKTFPARQSHHRLYDASKLDGRSFLHHALNSKATLVTLVSTEFESALERSFLRGTSEKRYVDIDALLEAHKNAPNSLIRGLDQTGITGTNTTVFMYDNNGPLGQDSILFCTINCQNSEITIYNEPMLNQWIKKSTLNGSIEFPKRYDPKAELTVDLYVGPTPSITEHFAPLLQRGYRLIHAHQKDEKQSLSM